MTVTKTISEQWKLMLNSFKDIKSAISEMGGTVEHGYNTYANSIRGIYSNIKSTVTAYPKTADITDKIQFCQTVKEEIRQAIIDGGVECDSSVPLFEYGNKIRQIENTEEFTIITESLPNGKVNTPYSTQLEATGGHPPYKWSKVNYGFYPSGISVNEDGTVTGTPTGAGTFPSFYVSCTDSTNKHTKVKQCNIRITK